jgi:hypothetical protein
MSRRHKTLIIAGIAAILISIYYFKVMLNEKVYCGTVTHKINALQYNKHNATPDPILIVDFDGYGKKEIHTSWITFTDNEVGSKVCFEKRIGEMEGGTIDDLAPLLLTFGFVGGIVLILAGLGAFNNNSYDSI